MSDDQNEPWNNIKDADSSAEKTSESISDQDNTLTTSVHQGHDLEDSDPYRQLGHDLAYRIPEGSLDDYLSALPPILSRALGKYIVLPSGEVTVSECAWVVFGIFARKRKLFLRTDTIVEVRRDLKGGLVLRAVTPEGLCSRIEGLGWQLKVFRNDAHHGHKERLKPGRLQPIMAKQLMDSLASGELLPHIRLVISCPAVTIGSDGKADFLREGFNPVFSKRSPEVGIFVAHGTQPPRFSVAEAADILLELISDYRFRKPGDKARALAWIITPALRLGGLLDCLTPLFVMEANRSQSAKSLFVYAIATIYGEVCGTTTQRKGGVSSTEELFDTLLQKRRPFIMFDNLDGAFESPRLESFITSSAGFAARGAYKAEEELDPRLYFVYASSNGFRCEREDLRNRMSIVQIVHRPKSDSFRFYREAWLRHIESNQSKYLGAVCSIAAAWLEDGRQVTNETRHYFREWAQPLDWIIKNYFNHPSVGRLMDDEVTRMFTGSLGDEPSIDEVDVPTVL